MSNQIILVTEPDDTMQDGTRLLFVNLDQEQTQFVSACLNKLESISTTIIYVWNTGDNAEWLLDKKFKSKLILFNADSGNDIVNGYLAAQSNSYYIGILRMLGGVNVNQILEQEQLINILAETLN